MVSSVLSAELAATCSALGYFDGHKYYIDKYCRETVKDLIRYLRHDDENHEIRRYLGEAKVLVTDLLPIAKHYHEDEDLFDVVLRLLVNLTNPALLLYREELPAEKISRNYYLQIISQLQGYKEAFNDEGLWAVMSKKLSDILQIDADERSEEKAMVLERILVLIRNVLQVPADPEAERRPDNDASVHDQVLWALHQSGIVDMILYMSSTHNEQAYFMHNLEIVSLMLRDQVASELANTALERSAEEKQKDEVALLEVRQKEQQIKQIKSHHYSGARHSRFGGTFVLSNVKSISDNDLILYKPVNKVDSLSLSDKKNKAKKPKNKVPMQGESDKRRSAFSVRLFLKEFCVEFLNGSYNRLMHYVKECLVRGVAQPNDESFYLWSIKFFMEFNRSYKLQVKLVCETMNIQCFHWVQSQLEHSHAMITSDKKKVFVWSRRMHLALRAYEELLLYLAAMESSSDKAIHDCAQVLQGNLFYLVEYRELLLTLIHSFDEVKMSRSYLKDLIETLHCFMKLMERFCKKQRGIVVQKKTMTKKKRVPKKSTPQTGPPAPPQSNEEMWDVVGPQLSVVLTSGVIPDDVVPFDGASDKDIDDQKVDAMRRIHTLLKHHQFEEAVGLMRASREVWPEQDVFGSAHMAPEEEFAALREVFFADISQDPEVARAAELARAGQEADREAEYDAEGEDDAEGGGEDEDDEEGEGAVSFQETELHFSDFLKRLVHSKAVSAAGLLLQTFDRNSIFTNHCATKLLHRIAWEAKMPGMLFQASLLRTFQRILSSRLPHHKELQKLAVFIIRKFSEVAAKNPLVYIELLFWKSAKDGMELEEGYGSYKEKSAASKKAWKEEEEDELRLLYQEFQRDQPGGDVVDWILERLINRERSKNGVRKKLQELFLLVPKSKIHVPKEWGEAEIVQLRELYDQFRDSACPMEDILSNLTVKRAKTRVIDKLLELGLVNDRKELHKKSNRKKSQSVRRGDLGGSESAPSDQESSGNDSDVNTKKTKTKDKKDGKGRDRITLKKNRRKKTGRAHPGQVKSLLLNVHNEGMDGGLIWLKESLEELAEDLQSESGTEDVDGVPLVPVGEDPLSAIEHPLFQRLLQSLGIVPPFDEQETYWRIPGDMKASELLQKASLIQSAVDGNLLSVEQNEDNNSFDQSHGDAVQTSSESEDEFSALRRMTTVPQDPDQNPAQNQPEESEDSRETTNLSQKKSQMKRNLRLKILQSDSGSDSDLNQIADFRGGHSSLQASIDSDPENDISVVSGNISSQRRRRTVIDSDSEPDSPVKEMKSPSKNSPLKESSLVNDTFVTSAITLSSEDEIGSNSESVLKTKKRVLSSSEESEAECSSLTTKRFKNVTNIRM